jgi:hypothetical protein
MPAPEVLAGWSALLAVGATIVGAVTIVLFFTRLVTSCLFLGLLGVGLLTGQIRVPAWNA